MNLYQQWLSLIAFIVVLATIFWVCEQRDTLKAEAVKRGAAEWIINPDNGETTFQWKEKP